MKFKHLWIVFFLALSVNAGASEPVTIAGITRNPGGARFLGRLPDTPLPAHLVVNAVGFRVRLHNLRVIFADGSSEDLTARIPVTSARSTVSPGQAISLNISRASGGVLGIEAQAESFGGVADLTIEALPGLVAVNSPPPLVPSPGEPIRPPVTRPRPVDDTPFGRACRGEIACHQLERGLERGLCQAYKEGTACFHALDGVDQGWCKALKENRRCIMALDGAAERAACERGDYPRHHRLWAQCAGVRLPDPPNPSPRVQACRRKIPCHHLERGRERGLCEAYVERTACFHAFDGAVDRGWCEVLKDNRRCVMGLDNRADREACEAGRFPEDHLFWKQCGGR